MLENKKTDKELIESIKKYLKAIPNKIGNKVVLDKIQKQQITLLISNEEVFWKLTYESKLELCSLLEDFYNEYKEIVLKINETVKKN